MTKFQIPLPGLSRSFGDLTEQEKDFIEYFTLIDDGCLLPAETCYAGVGPKGYGSALVISRIIKIKERILSDRQLARALKQNDLYRFVTKDIQPSHNTFNTLRRRLDCSGFIETHKGFVKKACQLGLLEPNIKQLPKSRKKGIIVVADSTFLITSGSTKGEKDKQGKWHFNDNSIAFLGKKHHRYKYAVGHKAHSMRTLSGIPLVTLLAPANKHDQNFILILIDEMVNRYPCYKFSYIILDRGYDTEEIHHDIYEMFGIIPIIIRKKMVYPKGFTADGYPLCPWGFTMKPRGIEYRHRRTKYACYKVCQDAKQPLLFSCKYDKEQNMFGYSFYTYFKDSYRKFGPAVPHSRIYQKLKPYRTGIERTFALVKENRYRMEASNRYKGIENVTIHAIEHDITLTQDIIFDFIKSNKLSPVLNLDY